MVDVLHALAEAARVQHGMEVAQRLMVLLVPLDDETVYSGHHLGAFFGFLQSRTAGRWLMMDGWWILGVEGEVIAAE